MAAEIVSATTPDARELSTADAVHTLVASFLGWTLDAFDFFILVFVLPTVAKDFHRSVPDIAFTITATLAMRPVGAVIFGWFADRYGRRLPLMVDVIFYSVVEVLSGLAPTYGWFLFFRALYGIGMGGEWGVGASIAMEAVPARWRGLLSGVLQEGYAVGYLLAAAAYFFVYPHFGWRPLFFLGGIPALLTLYIRAKVPESKSWSLSRPPSGAIWRALRRNFRRFLYLVALMTMMNLVSHGTQDMYPTFLKLERGLSVSCEVGYANSNCEKIAITGTKAGARIENPNAIVHVEPRGQRKRKIPLTDWIADTLAFGLKALRPERTMLRYTIAASLAAFFEALSKRQPFSPNFDDAIWNATCLEAAVRSIRENRFIEVSALASARNVNVRHQQA